MHKGFIRNRIENRIAGIRNRSRQDSGRSNSTPADASPPPVSGSMPSFSQLERMHSADSGFLLVDQVEGEGEGGKSQQEEGGEEGEDDGMVHLSLEQRVDDPLSDMEGELEGLVIPDEEEEGEEGVGGGDEEPVRSKRTERAAKEEVGKPWLEGNRDIYEQQLELLQEHLTEAMLSNQTLQGKLGGKGGHGRRREGHGRRKEGHGRRREGHGRRRGMGGGGRGMGEEGRAWEEEGGAWEEEAWVEEGGAWLEERGVEVGGREGHG